MHLPVASRGIRKLHKLDLPTAGTQQACFIAQQDAPLEHQAHEVARGKDAAYIASLRVAIADSVPAWIRKFPCFRHDGFDERSESIRDVNDGRRMVGEDLVGRNAGLHRAATISTSLPSGSSI